MKFQVLILLLVFALASCDNMFLGDPKGKQLMHEGHVDAWKFPFVKRTKTFFFIDEQLSRPINCIRAYDNLDSEATVRVISGGIGQSFVELELESERGKGLDYTIAIYT